MQYLLTAEEYEALTTHQARRIAADTDKLQALCTTIANRMPIIRDWDPEGASVPWGCILDKATDPGYCDDCPVPEICPFPHKKWSK